MRWTQGFAAACALVFGFMGAGTAKGQEQAAAKGQEQGAAMGQKSAKGEAQQRAACPEGAVPSVLSVGDFNGDTIVDGADLKELADRIARRDNVAFFDMNGDHAVDTKDMVLVARQVGARSTPVDQELAAVFRATERYRDIGNAIADGFVPVTGSAIGHGVHWARNQELDARFELTRPEGLNYSEDGKLLAAFYAILPGEPDTAPEGFTGDEPWHFHVEACFNGYDPENPSYDWRTIRFEECVPRKECAAEVWLAKFYMVHAWLFEQNPCGVFGLENPRITSGVDPAVAAVRCPEGGGHTGGHPAPSRPAGVCPPRSDAAAPGGGQREQAPEAPHGTGTGPQPSHTH
jgi:hypothetical protein